MKPLYASEGNLTDLSCRSMALKYIALEHSFLILANTTISTVHFAGTDAGLGTVRFVFLKLNAEQYAKLKN